MKRTRRHNPEPPPGDLADTLIAGLRELVRQTWALARR
jgi:hypothetical protein